jgi:hypothetical protein
MDVLLPKPERGPQIEGCLFHKMDIPSANGRGPLPASDTCLEGSPSSWMIRDENTMD